MPRKLTYKAFATNSPLRQIESDGAVDTSALASGAIDYHHCSWYSPNEIEGRGALQLPRGSTSSSPGPINPNNADDSRLSQMYSAFTIWEIEQATVI